MEIVTLSVDVLQMERRDVPLIARDKRFVALQPACYKAQDYALQPRPVRSQLVPLEIDVERATTAVTVAPAGAFFRDIGGRAARVTIYTSEAVNAPTGKHVFPAPVLEAYTVCPGRNEECSRSVLQMVERRPRLNAGDAAPPASRVLFVDLQAMTSVPGAVLVHAASGEVLPVAYLAPPPSSGETAAPRRVALLIDDVVETEFRLIALQLS